MQINFELTPRSDVPRWLAYATPVMTVLAALGAGAIALLAIDVNPIAAYQTMFVTTLTTEFGITETFIRAVPLILAGLAVYLPLRAQLWNIGAEGQLIIGAVAGCWIGLHVSLPAVLLVPLMFLAAAMAGGIWAGIPALLKAKWEINEIITTLLLTFVAINVMSYLVRGPMNAETGNFPQTDVLPDSAQLPAIPGTGVHVGLLVALATTFVLYFIMTQTRLGFAINVVGSNDKVAVRSGMSKATVYLFVLTIGGVLAAFAGIAEIAGNQSRLRAGFEPGYGFTAIPIALLGRNGAGRVVLAALFFAVLFVGGDSISVSYGVPAALIDILQALIILFLITAEFFKRYHVDLQIETSSGTPGHPVAEEQR